VAVANDATYVTRRPRAGGAVFALVRQSHLRAPLFPDPEADQGQHRFTSTITLGTTIADAVRRGYRVNLPLRPCAADAVAPLVTIDNPAIVVEAIKLAEDRSGDVVVAPVQVARWPGERAACAGIRLRRGPRDGLAGAAPVRLDDVIARTATPVAAPDSSL
jgi:hypothetical protein